MNNFIVSNLSDKLTKSVTLEIGSKAKNMIANGIKVNNLTLGEPDFTTPEYIGEGAIEAINKGHLDNRELWKGVPITPDGKVQLRDGRTGEAFDSQRFQVFPDWAGSVLAVIYFSIKKQKK